MASEDLLTGKTEKTSQFLWKLPSSIYQKGVWNFNEKKFYYLNKLVTKILRKNTDHSKVWNLNLM